MMVSRKTDIAKDPTIPTSGDPRQDQPLGGGGASGPNPDLQHKVRTGDRNAKGAFDADAKDLTTPKPRAEEVAS